MKYLAGLVKTPQSIMALCEPGSFDGPIDENAAYLSDDILPRMTLLRHQRAVVPRLILLEAAQTGRDESGSSFMSNMIYYCDNFGTGKTRTMLAMIAIAPLPLMAAPQVFISAVRGEQPVRIIVKNLRPNGRLTPTMIIVKSDVVGSWQQEAALLPELNIIRITSVFEFNEFSRVINSPGGIGKINAIDIIIVKFGDMTLGGKLVSIVSAIADVLHSHCVTLSRVIMDDHDQWKKSYTSIVPDASSYIAVSTTKKQARCVVNREWNTFTDIIKQIRPRISDLTGSRALSLRQIKSENDFIRRSVDVPALYRWIINCEDHKGIIAELFSGTADPNTARALEAFNGDAIKTTARLLNISATTPADIYAALMQGKETAVIKAKNRLERCFRLKKHIADTFRAMVDKNVGSITSIEIDTIGAWIHSGSETPPTHIKPRQGIIAVLDRYISEATDEETLALREINLVREMLARCCCEVCREHVGSDRAQETTRDGIIMQCCGKIVCRDCFTRDNKGKLRCPLNAKHEIKTNQIVFLSGKIDLNMVIDAAPDSATELVKFEVDGPVDGPMPFSDINNHKIRALLCIINGMRIPGSVVDTDELPLGVIIGDTYRECVGMRKVVVFAREKETIDNIQEILEEKNINYTILSGTHHELQNKIMNFRDDPEMRVMMIQSERHASGINLQFATDLVFYHKLCDKEIYRQATGRIQRFGRTCSGTIWRLQYDGERAG